MKHQNDNIPEVPSHPIARPAHPVPSGGPSKIMKILIIFIGTVLMISVLSVGIYFSLIYEEGGKDESSKEKNVLLIYDPTGKNFKTHGRENISYTAYIVEVIGDEVESYPVKIEEGVLSNPSLPIVISGKFEVKEVNGGKIVTNIESEKEQLSDVNISGKYFKNIVVSGKCVDIIYNEHAFGVLKSNETIFFASLDKKPAFFNDVRVEGVVIKKEIMDKLNFIDISIDTEYKKFIDAMSNFKISSEKMDTQIIFAYKIEYVKKTMISGDVLDIVAPEDISKFVKNMHGNISEESYTLITDILSKIGMELILFLPEDIKMKQNEIWFILGTTSLLRNESYGKVTIEISESSIDEINVSNEGNVKVKYGVTSDDKLKTSITNVEVREMWKLIKKGKNTISDGVKTTCFAMVMTLDDVITYLEAFSGSNADTLRLLTTVRNPGVALLIDYNFTEIFDNRNREFKEYLAIGLFPDFHLNPTQILYLVNLTGTLYDFGKYCDSKESTFPIVISDLVEDATPEIEEKTLEEIYNGAFKDKTVSHFRTDVFITGTTLKTIANYTKYIDPTPASQLILHSPVDVGIYDVFYSSDDERYHSALINFTLTKDTGPTYFMKHVNIQGFYINMEKYKDRLKDAYDAGYAFGDASLFIEFMKNTGQLSGDYVLEGAIVAYKVSIVPIEDMKIRRLNAGNVLMKDGETNLDIWGEVKNRGDMEWLPKIKCVIYPENGAPVYLEGIFYSDERGYVPTITILPDQSVYFMFCNTLTDDEISIGICRVEIYVVEFSEEFGLGRALCEAYAEFEIIDYDDIVYEVIAPVSVSYDEVFNVTLDISTDVESATLHYSTIPFRWDEIEMHEVSGSKWVAQLSFSKDLTRPLGYKCNIKIEIYLEYGPVISTKIYEIIVSS